MVEGLEVLEFDAKMNMCMESFYFVNHEYQ